jgi:hypothetical protein
LDFQDAELYFECIDIIESRQTLNQITASGFMDLKKDARNKIHKDLYKRSFPSIFKDEKQISLNDIAKILGK